MKNNNNPQAFPKLNVEKQSGGDYLYIQEKGMTLLDYFAGQALIGESVPDSDGRVWKPKQFPELAERVYNIAEAMLEERKKRL